MLISPDHLLRIYKESGRNTSWDIIAICASDSDQAFGYQLLGEKKFPRKQIRVYSDPPGPKIGNGGALLHCLSQLRDEFGPTRLHSLRTLFIPAGGMSQRSPWLAALGKLFAVMPTVNAGCLDMLDIIIALSEPFAKFAADIGVGCFFLACSDALLPCEFDSSSLLPSSTSSRRLAEADFVALAHPTRDLALASGHGIYCVDQNEVSDEASSSGLTVLDCCRVLQKPTIQEMNLTGGVISPKDGSALVDSNFWLNGGDALESILAWRDANALSMAGLELDAYGDVLRGLGRDARLSDYATETRNLTRPPSPSSASRLEQLRAGLFQLLQGRRLRLCRIDRSALVHIGSTREYLGALFQPIELARCFSVGAENGNARLENIVTCCSLSLDEGCLQFSGSGSALEFCHITARSCRIGAGCLLSHCLCTDLQADLSIPDGWVMQTVPLLHGGSVTWALHSDDNPKQRDFSAATFLGKPLTQFLSRHGIAPSAAWVNFGGTESLWTARLFPIDRRWIGEIKARKSFLTTLNALQSDDNARGLGRLSDWLAEAPEERRLMSMAEIAQEKDLQALIKFRMTFSE